MATIWKADSALARCRLCGLQQQFHSDNGVPHAKERDHPFVAETIDDFEPGDLTPEQLVSEIFRHPNTVRAVSCGEELRTRVRTVMGVAWDDLAEALA